MIWSPISGTDNDVAVLYFKNDGSLGLYREDNSSVWTPGIDTSTKHPQKLVLENDGRLVRLGRLKVRIYGTRIQLISATEVKIFL